MDGSVYILEEIQAERDRAVRQWGTDFDDRNTINDWASYICRYATKAADDNWDSNAARTNLVKAAGLCLSAIVSIDCAAGNIAKRHYDK